jgi:hypothetical protein
MENHEIMIALSNPWVWFAVIGAAWLLLPRSGVRRKRR